MHMALDEPERHAEASGLDLGIAGGGGASWTVRATKHVSYEVRVCEGVFDPHRTDLADVGGSGRVRRRFIAIDENVYRIYGSSLRRYFAEHGIGIHVEIVSADETRKSLETVARIARSIDAFGIARRHEPIIAVGGGVLLDIACLTADLYRRGTPVVRVPTTLDRTGGRGRRSEDSHQLQRP
jgi:3-dehydroquinate synthase